MAYRTSFWAKRELVEEAKKIGAIYGAKNLSAFINGFFHYLAFSENPHNGINIHRLLEDALSGNISKTRVAELRSGENRRQFVYNYLSSKRAYLAYDIRWKGINKTFEILHPYLLHAMCVEMYETEKFLILEDELFKYIRDWYNEISKSPRMEAVEVNILEEGGIKLFDQTLDNDSKEESCT